MKTSLKISTLLIIISPAIVHGDLVLEPPKPAYIYTQDEQMKNKAQWKSCTTDDTCAYLTDQCHNYTAINTKFIKEASAYYGYLKPRVNCSGGSGENPYAPAKCIEAQCREVEKASENKESVK